MGVRGKDGVRSELENQTEACEDTRKVNIEKGGSFYDFPGWS